MSCINFNQVETRFNNHHNTYVVKSKECLSEIHNGNGTKAWALCSFAIIVEIIFSTYLIKMVSVHSTQYHHQPSLNLGTCPNKFLYYILKRLSSHTLVDIVFSKYLMQMVRCILHSNLSNPLQYWAHVPPDSLSQSSAFSSNMAALMGRLPRCKLRKNRLYKPL